MPCLLALISHWLFYQFTQIERTQSINFRKQCESVCSADFHRQCKKKKQYLVINSLKFDKLFILHSWINESLKINFEQRKKCGDTVKFLRKAIFFKISKTVCYNLVKKINEGYKLKILGFFSIIHVTMVTTQTSFLL